MSSNGDGQRAVDVFDEAQRRHGKEREQYLGEACAGDVDLREELEALLAFTEQLPAALHEPTPGAGPSQLYDGQIVPERVGKYRVLGLIERGGMGTVLEATQDHPRRRVAIKVMRSCLTSRLARKRFEHEGALLAHLNHPGIAKVYDVGTYSYAEIGGRADERPFIAMERIEGARSITRYAYEHELGIEDRLQLFEAVCDAVQYAHQRGIIHRDLKPSNILVDAGGLPKLIDFGVALPMLDELRATTPLTRPGQVLGTFAYMSPEQARAETVDTRSDVYSLGAVLYELLCGRAPVELDDVGAAEAARALAERKPQRPSAVDARISSDLETVVLKALDKDIERRYTSVGALANDLRRFRAGEAILARPPSVAYQLRVFTHRHKGLVAGIAASVLAAGVGIGNTVSARAALSREVVAVKQLSDARDLGNLIDRAAKLWPPYAEQIPAYQEWIVDARRLAATLDHADPLTGAASHRAQLAEVEARLADPRSAPDQRKHDAWWHGHLADLVAQLEAFVHTETGLFESGISPDHGWGMGKRIEFARMLRERFAPGGVYALRWERALVAIDEHPAYDGLELVPQMGLVPIGPDPRSGFWEFWHVATGEEPLRDAGNELIVTEQTGVVLVLLPGGTFWMGVQDEDPAGPNYDPNAFAPIPPRIGIVVDAQPVHEVTLSPFFLSKYELNQGQWVRFVGSNPSRLQPSRRFPALDLRHPVERVSWSRSHEQLGAMGLCLPSEAQWEYAARGGTETPWWTGATPESLNEQNAANLADVSLEEAGYRFRYPAQPELNDGHSIHAPVGTFAANPFGLHDLHGNVFEWCLDGYDGHYYGRSERRDPVAPDASPHVFRDGSFDYWAVLARSYYRHSSDGGAPHRGIRPGRMIEPLRGGDG